MVNLDELYKEIEKIEKDVDDNVTSNDDARDQIKQVCIDYIEKGCEK